MDNVFDEFVQIDRELMEEIIKYYKINVDINNLTIKTTDCIKKLMYSDNESIAFIMMKKNDLRLLRVEDCENSETQFYLLGDDVQVSYIGDITVFDNEEGHVVKFDGKRFNGDKQLVINKLEENKYRDDDMEW